MGTGGIRRHHFRDVSSQRVHGVPAFPTTAGGRRGPPLREGEHTLGRLPRLRFTPGLRTRNATAPNDRESAPQEYGDTISKTYQVNVFMVSPEKTWCPRRHTKGPPV